MEREILTFETALGEEVLLCVAPPRALEPVGFRKVEDHRHVGSDARGCPLVEVPDLLQVDPTAEALIGDARVGEAVAEHGRTRLERRLDDVDHVLAARRGEEEQLDRGVHPLGLRVEQDRTHAVADRRAARLLRDDAVLSVTAEEFCEALKLRRLAAPLDSLDGKKEAIHGGGILAFLPGRREDGRTSRAKGHRPKQAKQANSIGCGADTLVCARREAPQSRDAWGL